MSIFGGRTTFAKRLVGSVASVALMIVSVETSHAAGVADSLPQYGALRPDGFASMLRLRIPFGGGSHAEARPTFALGFGPTWRFESAKPNFPSYQHTPSVEAGLTFGGAPVLKFGSVDLLRVSPKLRANADATGNSGSVPSWVWWTLGGVVVLGVAVLVARSRGSSGCNPLYGVDTDCNYSP